MAKMLPSISLADNLFLSYVMISRFAIVLCPVVFMNTSIRKASAGILFTWVAPRFY